MSYYITLYLLFYFLPKRIKLEIIDHYTKGFPMINIFVCFANTIIAKSFKNAIQIALLLHTTHFGRLALYALSRVKLVSRRNRIIPFLRMCAR